MTEVRITHKKLPHIGNKGQRTSLLTEGENNKIAQLQALHYMTSDTIVLHNRKNSFSERLTPYLLMMLKPSQS